MNAVLAPLVELVHGVRWRALVALWLLVLAATTLLVATGAPAALSGIALGGAATMIAITVALGARAEAPGPSTWKADPDVHGPVIDELTGVFNRRYLQDRLRSELERGARAGTPVGLIIIDIDDFNHVNHVHGHPFGDEVLITFATVLREHAGLGDVVCRLGGDEFGVILRNADEALATRTADNLVRAVRASSWGEAGPITASAGAAVTSGPDDVVHLYRAADQRLVAAKARGKDRAVIELHN